jgi:hypothetical protein
MFKRASSKKLVNGGDEVDINAACIIIGSPILEDIPQPRIAVLGLTLEGLPGREAPVFRLLSKETSDLHISLDDQFSIPFGLDMAIVTLHCTLLPRIRIFRMYIW